MAEAPESCDAEPVVTTTEELIRARLSAALGGWRGAVETGLPIVVFVLVWSASADLAAAAWSAVALAVVFAIGRLLQRSSLQHVLGGVVAMAVAAWFATRTGRAEDVFLPGILFSAAYGVASVVSILVRWPLVGFLVGMADLAEEQDPTAWHRDPAVVAVCIRLTWVVVGLYVLRLGIMGPLYLAGDIAALTVAKVVLGWPAWVGAVAVMGSMLVRGQTPLSAVGATQGVDLTPDDGADAPRG